MERETIIKPKLNVNDTEVWDKGKGLRNLGTLKKQPCIKVTRELWITEPKRRIQGINVFR